MKQWTQPPIAKVYEALSAIGDDRVKITSDNSATVISSSGDKSYNVTWDDDLTLIDSNDNASFWVGYLGYPILAVLMKLDRLQYNPEVAGQLKGIPWKKLNDKHKRKYDKAIEEALSEIGSQDISADAIKQHAEAIYDQVKLLNLRRPQRKPAARRR